MNYENVIGGNAKKFVNEYRPNLKGVKRLELEQMLREFAIEQVKLLATPAVVGQSEQLVCPECSSEDPDYSRGEYHCRCCGHNWAN